jgi:type I restriction enzyme, S subunit
VTETGRVRLANWRWTSVGDLGDVSGGVTKNSSKANLPITLPYLRVANVYANELRLDDVAEIGVTQAESVRALLAKGDLLIVEGNGSIDQIGRVAIWSGKISPCLHQNHLIKVRFAISGLEPFVLYWLLSPDGREHVVRAASSTSGLHTLSLSKVASLPAPLAPLPEQHRIVEAIESYFTRLDDAVATLERVERNLKRYRASVLKAAVEGRLVPTEAEVARAEGRDYEPASVLLERILAERRRRWHKAGARGSYDEPVAPDTIDLPELPTGWCWASIDQIGDVSGGLTKNAGRAAHDRMAPYLRVANVYADELRLDDVSEIGIRDSEMAKLLLRKGDLLVVEGNGSIEQIGRVALWDGSIDGCVHQNHLIKIRFWLVSMAGWALRWLLSPSGRREIQRAASSTSGLHTLSISKVARLPIPLCPLAEQARITSEVEELVSIGPSCSTIAQHSQKRAGRLRQSILKWAFEGRLADQDPSDEPASVLFERIRSETSASRQTASKSRVSRIVSIQKRRRASSGRQTR